MRTVNTPARLAARAAGEARYYGAPCKYGHTSGFNTVNASCIECVRLRNRARMQAMDPQKALTIGRRWRGLPEPTRPAPDVCECCGQKPEGSLCLDHDHTTGAFRGWLCHRCNMALGMLGDSVEGILKAIRYMRSARQ